VKSLGEKRAKSKRLIFGLLLLLAFSVILTVSLGLALSSTGNSQESNILSTDPVSTTDDANRIAMPAIEQYAEENNRTITTVEATLRNSTRFYWFIEAGFEAVEGKGYHERSCAYQVSVWEDTGEIWHQGPIWQNAWRNVSVSDNLIKIPVDEAIAIALPVSEQYAKENNRTITTVEASLSNYVDSRPSWHINIKFEAVKNGEHYWKDAQYWIDAYQVSVWADTGDIQSHNERGWY
jgi:hypothetical protein